MSFAEINRRQFIQGMMASSIFPTFTLLGCGPNTAIGGQKLHGRTMGTTYSVRISRLPSGLDILLLRREIVGVLNAVDRQMSTFRPESEVSQFNVSSGDTWFPVSPDIAAVVKEAVAISDLTQGAFDVTSGSLVELWGFGPAPRRTAPPADWEIASYRARTGTGSLDVRNGHPALLKYQPGLRIDLSGIAKGFAVDRIAARLVERGITDFLVEVGGEIRARGRNFRGGPWSIGIERPQSDRRAVQRVITLSEGSVATSGDYRSWYQLGERRYSHVIDPREGRPVTHSLTSVTVISEDAMRSDALSTGLLVLGPNEGREIARRAGIAALFVVCGNEGFEEWASPAFKKMIEG